MYYLTRTILLYHITCITSFLSNSIVSFLTAGPMSSPSSWVFHSAQHWAACIRGSWYEDLLIKFGALCVCVTKGESIVRHLLFRVTLCIYLNKFISPFHPASGNKKSSCSWEISERWRGQWDSDFVSYGWPRTCAGAGSVLVWVWDTDGGTGEWLVTPAGFGNLRLEVFTNRIAIRNDWGEVGRSWVEKSRSAYNQK